MLYCGTCTFMFCDVATLFAHVKYTSLLCVVATKKMATSMSPASPARSRIYRRLWLLYTHHQHRLSPQQRRALLYLQLPTTILRHHRDLRRLPQHLQRPHHRLLCVPHERIKKITCMNGKLVCRDV